MALVRATVDLARWDPRRDQALEVWKRREFEKQGIVYRGYYPTPPYTCREAPELGAHIFMVEQGEAEPHWQAVDLTEAETRMAAHIDRCEMERRVIRRPSLASVLRLELWLWSLRFRTLYARVARHVYQVHIYNQAWAVMQLRPELQVTALAIWVQGDDLGRWPLGVFDPSSVRRGVA